MPWPNLTEGELDFVWERTEGACYWCGEKHARGRPGRRTWDADHLKPRSKGGEDDVSNLVVACPECNRSRRDQDADDFDEKWENDSVVGQMYDLTPMGHRSVGLFNQHRRG